MQGGVNRVNRSSDQITIGIPSKGRLKEHTAKVLEALGYHLPQEKNRKLQSAFVDMPNHKILFFHAKDIPVMVSQRHLDIGFTGLDLIYERNAKVRPVTKLNRGQVKVVIAVRNDSNINHPFHLMNRTIATPFPNITQEYFDRLKVPVNVISVSGSSEGMGYISTVDAIADVTETGSTIRENDLRIIADDVFDSELVCIVNKPEHESNYRLVNQFLRRLYHETTD